MIDTVLRTLCFNRPLSGRDREIRTKGILILLVISYNFLDASIHNGSRTLHQDNCIAADPFRRL